MYYNQESKISEVDRENSSYIHHVTLGGNYGVELLIIRIIYIYISILKVLVLFVRVKLNEIISMVRKQTFVYKRYLLARAKIAGIVKRSIQDAAYVVKHANTCQNFDQSETRLVLESDQKRNQAKNS